ncbi:transposase [Klebsiella pneumoniae]|uniref:IS66 family transposase n=1 Tax=Klebsiella pneumoniae TaxID=573 RepID=UPI003970ADCC
MDALCYYCEDTAEPDNNVAERALQAVCLGKKNFIFSAATTVVSAEPCRMD